MRETLLEKRLQGIVIGMRHHIFGKDTVKHFGPVGGAAASQGISASWIAVGRSVRTNPNEVNRRAGPRRARNRTSGRRAHDRARNVRATGRGASDVGHMQDLARSKCELILVIFGKGPAAVCGPQYGGKVKTGLRIRRILVMDGEQPVPLRADVANLEKNVSGQFALNRQIVLGRILRAEFGGKLSERSEEHTSELQSLRHLVCRLLLEKKKRDVLVPSQYKQQLRPP